jgi:hypothetical protein
MRVILRVEDARAYGRGHGDDWIIGIEFDFSLIIWLKSDKRTGNTIPLVPRT